MTYPPIYDPTLTLNSRRFLTLSPHRTAHGDAAQAAATTRRLDTSHGRPPPPPLPPRPLPVGTVDVDMTAAMEEHLQPQQQEGRAQAAGEDDSHSHSHANRRPGSSSTFSNPGSLPSPPPPPHHHHQEHEQEQPANTDPTAAPDNAKRAAEEATYLVEVTNHPELQNTQARARALADRAAYDAVLLVYDVGSRASFDAAARLHGEIPLQARRRRHFQRHKNRRKRGHRRDDDSDDNGGGGGGGTGTGETVVALVGNKSDYDDGYEDATYYGRRRYAAPQENDEVRLAKEAALQSADIEERSLVHPLYRSSRVFLSEEDGADGADPPLSPRSFWSAPVPSNIVRGGRLVAAAGGRGRVSAGGGRPRAAVCVFGWWRRRSRGRRSRGRRSGGLEPRVGGVLCGRAAVAGAGARGPGPGSAPAAAAAAAATSSARAAAGAAAQRGRELDQDGQSGGARGGRRGYGRRRAATAAAADARRRHQSRLMRQRLVVIGSHGGGEAASVAVRGRDARAAAAGQRALLRDERQDGRLRRGHVRGDCARGAARDGRGPRPRPCRERPPGGYEYAAGQGGAEEKTYGRRRWWQQQRPGVSR
ncbi:hypothetical protein B0T24DRAFT_201444 [Lasiosphaeria ovina]|uniref:Uncharacterized protein n=1 Tax=Lasiosphaeria ovina TaxID=92902 RepID=A0AAE0JRX9_9PEZI|nr:hypothetical protein B0T24DRAFT_201444 [Lasiosphaeria ovina]